MFGAWFDSGNAATHLRPSADSEYSGRSLSLQVREQGTLSNCVAATSGVTFTKDDLCNPFQSHLDSFTGVHDSWLFV
jgi:hypothetical protein